MVCVRECQNVNDDIVFCSDYTLNDVSKNKNKVEKKGRKKNETTTQHWCTGKGNGQRRYTYFPTDSSSPSFDID